MGLVTMNINEIEASAATQARAKTDHETINLYAECMGEGDQFPPVIVFAEEGAQTGFYLADGFHRIQAAMKRGITQIDVDLRIGTFRDALKFALSANEKHGLRRTNRDKRNAVNLALKDVDWGQQSNREIAELCGVSHTFVNNVKAEADNPPAKSSNKTTKDDAHSADDNMRPTMPPVSQGSATLRALNEAFETIALCEVDGYTAASDWGEDLGEYFSAACEWIDGAKVRLSEDA